MKILKLGLNPTSSEPFPRCSPAPFVLTATTMSRRALPARRLLSSVLFHVLAMAAVLFLPMSSGFTEPPRPGDLAALLERREVIYLPGLRATLPAISAPGEEGKPGDQGSSVPGTQGFSYPGPQSILSDLPKSSNR